MCSQNRSASMISAPFEAVRRYVHFGGPFRGMQRRGLAGYAGQSLRHGRRAMEQDTTLTWPSIRARSGLLLRLRRAASAKKCASSALSPVGRRRSQAGRQTGEAACQRLAFCYEAGPTGYGLYRQHRALGYDCAVVAPSMVPVRPGGHIKTDRRDATTLAALFRAGELTAIWVPDAAHEAMRDLSRGRQAAMEGLRRARQQLLVLLVAPWSHLPARAHWTTRPSPVARRAALRTRRPADRFEELIQAVEQAQARRERLERQMVVLLPDWSLRGGCRSSAGPARRRPTVGDHADGRDRRLPSLRQPARNDGLARSGAA